MVYTELTVISGDSSKIQAPPGYTRIDQDLNQGASGKYIYLCYQIGEGPAITDITFIEGDSSNITAPAGYTKIGVDLNQGAGGKYIYLCYQKRKGPAITNLSFHVSDDNLPLISSQPGAITVIPQNLNQAAGGKYIYLCTDRNAANWMEQLAEQIGNRPLNRIAIPGTHDSATYSFSPNGELSPDSPDLTQKLQQLPDIKKIVYNWARTQNYSISQQLEAGIRYLDIRVATYRDYDDYSDIRIVHSMWGISVIDAIQQVDAFMRKYPKEIVLLRFGTNKPGAMSSQSKSRLIEKLKQTFSDILVPTIFDATVTPAELWATTPSKRLIVLFNWALYADTPVGDRILFWEDESWEYSGSKLGADGTTDLSKLKASLQSGIDKAITNPHKFFGLGLSLTPDTELILKSELSEVLEGGGSLYKNCAKDATTAGMQWLRTQWFNKPINIFSTDFFQMAQTVDTALLLNQRPLPPEYGFTSRGLGVTAVGQDSIPGQLDSLYIFTRDPNGLLYSRGYRNGWQDWQPIDQFVASAPAVISSVSGQFDLVAQGMHKNLLHGWYNGAKWVWETLQDEDDEVGFPNTPVIASRSLGWLDVFVQRDGDLWHRGREHGNWHKWESLGGTITSAPGVTSNGNGQLDVLARGTDNGVWHKRFDGRWHDWQPLGGVVTSAPCVTSSGNGRLDAFVRGTDNGVWHNYFEGRWHDWQPLGGVFTSAPAALSTGTGQLQVFVRGTDNGVWHNHFDGTWHSWEPLGGNIA